MMDLEVTHFFGGGGGGGGKGRCLAGAKSHPAGLITAHPRAPKGGIKKGRVCGWAGQAKPLPNKRVGH